MWLLPTTALRLLLVSIIAGAAEWKCPEFNNETTISCACDFPHTLRCSGNASSLPVVPGKLRSLTPDASVSLLDYTVQNLTLLPDSFLAGVSLHGLVITSGELRNVSRYAFRGLLTPLQALGLPNNHLETIPTASFGPLNSLERLDLSNNELNQIRSGSFHGLDSLTFLDLSENRISDVEENAFVDVRNLKVLKLRRNRIGPNAVSGLSGLAALEELDLSTNALTGQLRSDSFPSLPSMRTLLLSDNQFGSISRGALTGASSLVTLSLNHNLIDVLEDHAFRELPGLRSLDLANNRIVAISGASLAHLNRLTELDLSHNFLRALTGDIVLPLKSLRVLRLDDNDISMVDSDGWMGKTTLERLTLSDNPLNCDCEIVEFAVWFNNISRLSLDDRSTAVCMTPPHYENALLMEIPPNELVCGDDDDEFLDQSLSAHVSGARVVLRAFNFNGSVITLLWSIDSEVKTFSCDALFIYEEMATHEVLLNSTPLRCNSSELPDPTALMIALPLGSMKPYHRYRYCVVLLEDGKLSDEMQLILGCSEVMPLIAEKSLPMPPPVAFTHIASLRANVSYNVLSVSIGLWTDRKTPDPNCRITVSVFMMGTLLEQQSLNCSSPTTAITGLPQGHYHVCASLGSYSMAESKLQCITVKGERMKGSSGSLLIVCFVLLTAFVLFGVYLVARRMYRRPRSTTHQCFLATAEGDDDERKQHSRYVKLQATIVM